MSLSFFFPCSLDKLTDQDGIRSKRKRLVSAPTDRENTHKKSQEVFGTDQPQERKHKTRLGLVRRDKTDIRTLRPSNDRRLQDIDGRVEVEGVGHLKGRGWGCRI